MGLDPLWLDFTFFGAPRFQSRGPKKIILKVLRTSEQKIEAPKKREIGTTTDPPPLLGPLTTSAFWGLKMGLD